MPAPAFAVIVCTRNRPTDLAYTLASIGSRANPGMEVLVVDASTPAHQAQNATTIAAFTAAPIRHLCFPGKPSLARQRNYGIDHLPASIEIVHFLDDDVTVHPGYFRALNAVFAADPSVAGAGGRLLQPALAAPRVRWWHRLFLLDHPAPGRVLASGAATAAQTRPLAGPTPVTWLGGCCAYRRQVFARHRFDPLLDGYALDEDLDFSYRVGRSARLVVEPRAVLTHHVSPVNRASAAQHAHDALVHRYWFLEKNLRHPLRKPAFWWSVCGRLLAAALSRNPAARAVLRGRLRALATLLRRDHPLLRASYPPGPRN